LTATADRGFPHTLNARNASCSIARILPQPPRMNLVEGLIEQRVPLVKVHCHGLELLLLAAATRKHGMETRVSIRFYVGMYSSTIAGRLRLNRLRTECPSRVALRPIYAGYRSLPREFLGT
jgi:hypothetical protein